jgi:hypothetical protein
VRGLELQNGLNVVIFKVVNQGGGWEGSVRFTDENGLPLRGLTLTLDPDYPGAR